MRIRADLLRLQDTTAQIRVRGAFVLLVGFAAAAQELGLEVILGTFAAGAILSLADPDRAMTHPEFRRKLEAVGFGVFIPIFFVSSGVRYDLGALAGSASSVAMVPLFLVALLVVRGLPALLYRSLLNGRETLVAGLLQATSLPFLVAAAAIGQRARPDRRRPRAPRSSAAACCPCSCSQRPGWRCCAATRDDHASPTRLLNLRRRGGLRATAGERVRGAGAASARRSRSAPRPSPGRRSGRPVTWARASPRIPR